MPIYEFGCNKCGQEFEEIIFNDENCVCPHCGSSDTIKLMSSPARHKNSNATQGAPVSRGGCAGCSGGNCATCGH